MPTPEQETHPFLFRLFIYSIGTIMGVSAKLADMNRVKKITVGDAVVNFTVAAAAAFFVYQVLEVTGHKEMANVMSVICGRYADDVLRMGWKMAKKLLGNAHDEINKDEK